MTLCIWFCHFSTSITCDTKVKKARFSKRKMYRYISKQTKKSLESVVLLWIYATQKHTEFKTVELSFVYLLYSKSIGSCIQY